MDLSHSPHQGPKKIRLGHLFWAGFAEIFRKEGNSCIATLKPLLGSSASDRTGVGAVPKPVAGGGGLQQHHGRFQNSCVRASQQPPGA
jgi:hypothetical protein